MSRWAIGIAIVVFWAVMMGLLLQRELGVQQLSSRSSVPQEPTETWLSVSVVGGQRIGSIHVRQTPEVRQGVAGVTMQMEAQMGLDLLNKRTDLNLSGSIWQALAEPSVEFGFDVQSSGYDFRILGTVQDGALKAEIVSAGETFPLSLVVDDQLLFSSGLGSAVRFPVLEVGEEYRVETFDPLTMSKGWARIRCDARETLRLGESAVETRRLLVRMNGFESTAWIDDRGEVVRAETPVGLVLERITAREAQLPLPEGELQLDLLDRTSIKPSGLRPFRGARSMAVQLQGLGSSREAALELPQDQVQVSEGQQRYRLVVPDVPNAGSTVAEVMDSDGIDPAFLAADALVQSDHPKIRARAQAIVEPDRPPWVKAVAIHDWVFAHLEKEPVLSIPSALEVLERRAGDCNEHTVLFTALARAVGLPTRIAIGLVWSDELEGFYYHAWPEVFIGRWYWMDPTLGQSLADATHIKLFNGGIETWPRLLPFLGSLEIEVTDIE